MWYVYIVECKDGSLYTGVSLDIERRMLEHANGKGARYTRIRKFKKLLYYEIHSSKSEALSRERQIKGWRREKKQNLIKFGKP